MDAFQYGFVGSICHRINCTVNLAMSIFDRKMFRGKSLRPRPYSHGQRPDTAGHQHHHHTSGPTDHHQAQRVPAGHARPHYNPRHAAPNEVIETVEETVYRDRLCTLCSDRQYSVHHHHISSESARVFAKQHIRDSHLFGCLMCKSQESVVRPSTRKLILTTSTLYNVWTQSSFKPDIHMEIESIVGGRIRDLTRALMMLYLIHPERLEIIVVAGLNNIGDSQPVPNILDEIVELKQTVQAHTNKFRYNPPSVVSFSTLLYAPKFCSLDVPAAFPEWLPPPGFKNRRNDTECLNVAIAALNKSAGVNYLKLHYEGARIDPKSGKVMHKHNPVKPVWREVDIRRRLHLTPEHKVKVAYLAAKLFKGGLTNLGTWNQQRAGQ